MVMVPYLGQETLAKVSEIREQTLHSCLQCQTLWVTRSLARLGLGSPLSEHQQVRSLEGHL